MKRDIFNKLQEWSLKPRRKPLILRGARQVGKTYILREFGTRNFTRYHYVNFEKTKEVASIFEETLDPKKIIQRLRFILDTSIDIHKELLIFDEIQECPKALTSLKYFSEDMPELALCSAGSLLGVHLTPVSFPVGKVDTLFMYPMSFREFLLALQEERSLEYLEELSKLKPLPQVVHEHLWQRLKWYFVTGGLPEVVDSFRREKDNLYVACTNARKIQKELIIAYNADMAKHAGKINSMHLDRLFHAIPEQLAKSQDGTAKKFIFKDAVPGINRFDRLSGVIDWLEKAGLIIKVKIVHSALLPFTAHTQENMFKLLLFDVGILGALSELEPKTILDQDYGSYKGYFAENYVAEELLSSGNDHLYSWQGRTAEVEFLLQLDKDAIPVEVKSGNSTHAKSLQVFAQKYLPPFRVLLSAQNVKFDERSSTHYFPLYAAGRLMDLLIHK